MKIQRAERAWAVWNNEGPCLARPWSQGHSRPGETVQTRNVRPAREPVPVDQKCARRDAPKAKDPRLACRLHPDPWVPRRPAPGVHLNRSGKGPSDPSELCGTRLFLAHSARCHPSRKPRPLQGGQRFRHSCPGRLPTTQEVCSDDAPSRCRAGFQQQRSWLRFRYG